MKYALEETGATKFRVPLPLGRKTASFRACVDGQMGEVIKCYREWKLSGDTQWIKESAAERQNRSSICGWRRNCIRCKRGKDPFPTFDHL